MRLRGPCALVFAVWATVHAQETPVPAFDHEGVAASYVVSLPPGYDAARRWPLILDFHGAIAPSRKGAVVTRGRLWSAFVERVPCVVVGLNGRKRAWGMVRGDRHDRAYALHVLKAVREKYSVDPKRIYLAGFSSGSDFLCKSNLQLEGPFAGSLVTCPGPATVVGLRGGELLRAKEHPFVFVAGEEDYIRKDGAWQAYLALEKAGARVMYREVPGVGHDFFPLEEYERLFRYLETFQADAAQALRRGDYLLASVHGSKDLLKTIEEKGKELVLEAEKINPVLELGRAYEAWWRIRTQFHRFKDLAARAQRELDELGKIGTRELYRARRQWFRTRGEERDERWTFDRYLTYDEVKERLHDLAQRDGVELKSIGKSVEGRDIWALAIGGDDHPAAFVMGGLHGNEVSSVMTALYVAWQFATNPMDRRTQRRLRENTTLYVVPVANPDGLHHHLAEPFSHWRPRFNYRPFDADKDGQVDEDGVEDLDGDGEIGLMYRPDPKGRYTFDGKKYTMVAYEGIDNDGDGKFNEDPKGGVDLNRNFPVGFRSRTRFKGFSGPQALSEPETQAVARFVEAHDNVALFFDVHNAVDCVFFWRGAGLDNALYDELAKRSGYPPKPLDHQGAGLSIAWAYGALGRLGFLIELEPGDWEEKIPLRPFRHPQLGDILLGNESKKLAKRNPRPARLAAVADRCWKWIASELERLPRLELVNPRILDGKFVTGAVKNAGALPTDTAQAGKLGTAVPVRAGDVELGTLAPGEERPFRVELPPDAQDLVVRHPRAGTVTLPLRRPHKATVPIRRAYTIEPGYVTADQARHVQLKEELGPAFELTHRKNVLRVAVLLGEWKDERHSVPKEAFEAALFGPYAGRSPSGREVYGSVRDFFREMSYGRMDVSGRVFDWVELEGTYAQYRDASFGSPIVRTKLTAAVRKRYGKDALEGFDGYAFIWAGNAVRRTSALWPMRLTLKDRPGKAAFKMGEFHQGEFSPIGVACHELGHTFGVNDKYGLGATRNPLGPWCLMGRGTHGAEPARRHRPFHMCAWCKMIIGWVEPAVIDPREPQKIALRPITFGPKECVRVLLKPDGSEYLLLENRRREGFFTDLPSPGLAVLRVGPNDNPTYPQTRVQLLPAHGLPPPRRGDVADPARVAWPQAGKTELTVDGVRLFNIRLADDVVYLEVARSP